MNQITDLAFSTNPNFDSITVENYISSLNGGPLHLLADPVNNLDAVTKQYVDISVSQHTTSSSTTPPANPVANQLWYSTTDAQLYIWYTDPNSSQWVIANNTGIQDAPSGPNTYARQNGQWVAVLPLSGGIMMGPLVLNQDPTAYFEAATKGYVDTNLANYLPLTGGQLTGPLVLAADPTAASQAATKYYVDTHNSQVPVATGAPMNPLNGQLWFDSSNDQLYVWDGAVWQPATSTIPGGPYLALSGGTLTGPLTLNADPTAPLQAATKYYVDSAITGILPEAPMDGQSYGRMLDAWDPVLPITGGIMRGAINMNGWGLTGVPTPVGPSDAVDKAYVDQHATSSVGAAPPVSPMAGTLWWDTNDVKLYIWDGTQWISTINTPEFQTSGTVTGVPEAPTDGQLYARDGQLTNWQPAVPLSGGTMTGALTATVVTASSAVTTGGSGGPTWTTGAAVPSSNQPRGSMYSRTGGAVGTTLYVSQGGGTWNPVAGV